MVFLGNKLPLGRSFGLGKRLQKGERRRREQTSQVLESLRIGELVIAAMMEVNALKLFKAKHF